MNEGRKIEPNQRAVFQMPWTNNGSHAAVRDKNNAAFLEACLVPERYKIPSFFQTWREDFPLH
jgi:hypothetical protein